MPIPLVPLLRHLPQFRHWIVSSSRDLRCPSATISHALLKRLSAAQKIGLVVAALFYVVAGMLHFIKPAAYLRIMPPYIPWHLAMVRLSGACEILGGLGLLVSRTRRPAAWGLIVLLIAVFPANIYMATNPIEAGATSIAPICDSSLPHPSSRFDQAVLSSRIPGRHGLD